MIALLAMVAALSVTGATSHPAIDTGVVYLRIENHGASDRLVGARSTIAQSTSLHESMATKMNGMNGSMMMPEKSIAIPAHGGVVFQPGGYHIMLEHLKQPLAAGEHFHVQLHFAHAGWVDVPVIVEPY